MNCITCNNPLIGQQKKYCCLKCKNQYSNNKFQQYQLQQNRGIKRKKQFVNQLGGKCSVCGYDKNLAGLTFHHLNPNEKELRLDIRSMSNNNFNVLQKEVKKCQLVCYNCHMEIEHPVYENWKDGTPSGNQTQETPL